MTRGVIWDLGNVLIDWQPLPAIAAAVGHDEAARFLAARDFDFMAWNHEMDSGRPFAEAEEAVGRDFPHWEQHARAYRANFAASLVGEVPGSADVVHDLHAAGVRMWGLTNWSGETYGHAPERFEVLGLLEDVVVSGTERVAKPDPRIFRVAVERTGLPAGDLVFVDDKQANVDAAVAAGLDGVLFTGAADLRTALRERGLPV